LPDEHSFRRDLRAHLHPQVLFLALVFTVFAVAAPLSGLRPSDPTRAFPFWFFMVVLLVAALYFDSLAAWGLFGHEVLVVEDGALHVEKRLFGRVLSSKSYRASGMERLRLDPISEQRLRWNNPRHELGFGFGAGPILFVYDHQEVRLAESLRVDTAAAEALLTLLAASLGVLRADSPTVDGR
jgi:hypothetical protein